MPAHSPSRIPVILTAFGTQKDSQEVRDFLEARFREAFPQCDFHWAFASRSVQQHRTSHTPPPPELILRQLADAGHPCALIQSLHMVCAAEFHKLAALRRNAPLRTGLGLPLLASVEDCHQAALTLDEAAQLPEDTALVLALHGSIHPGGAFFHLFGKIFMETWGKRAFYGMIEGAPGKEEVARKVFEAGFTKAHILPFTLVKGRHFEEDLMGETNSWRKTFLAMGLTPDIPSRPMGLRPGIARIFCQHLEKALLSQI
jgi:sirohydrochlorin cobaltochelatase